MYLIGIWWKENELNIDAKYEKPYNYYNLRKIIYHQYLPMLIGIFNPMGV